ncbi:carbamoyltransferase HypF [Calidifontimicrobium sp. SYSU G02091]|uniref:Kae1-like domain-containing protein n=1 Tax=Calidifontimicrobium sp. SYSU G02091 TaxID=2926421 RepID=UPI001F52B52E|nr:carbamoyltransferase HypF [Calidifontimicrobium sp. SYSU G02091]MCI1191887.1 carbamoyltransferase HypF [Calidifontimicrobium sp. SYSU G02091]
MNETATLPSSAPARVLACGAFLKNRAARLEGDRLAWSALHGDLGTAEACRALDDAAEALLAQGGVDAIAHDLHPDFHSTRLAQSLSERLGVPAIGVQHHHAHIAAVIAEAGLARPVIGIALDGVGLGTDGTAWGGELLWVDGGDHAHRWERIGHLHPIALPGGDVAAREPWRLAAAVLHALGRGDEIEARFAGAVPALTARGLKTMLDRGLNCPASTGAGRWFDAAAGALGLSIRQAFEAEAAIALERLATQALPDDTQAATFAPTLDLRGVVAGLFDVPRDAEPARARAALRFHHALADGLADAAVRASHERGCDTVVFGGGCFLNRVLSERLARQLQAAGLAVHAPRQTPCGDAGLALGQAWVAACRVARATLSSNALALES